MYSHKFISFYIQFLEQTVATTPHVALGWCSSPKKPPRSLQWLWCARCSSLIVQCCRWMGVFFSRNGCLNDVFFPILLFPFLFVWFGRNKHFLDEWLNRRKLVANQKRHWSQWSTEFPSEVADVSRSTSEILRGETAWKHRREWVNRWEGVNGSMSKPPYFYSQ